MIESPEDARCAVLAAERGEPMFGTAPRADGFLLIEQPGGWGAKPFRESGLDPSVGAAMEAKAESAGLRPLLVRRSPAPDRGRTGRGWWLVDARPGHERIVGGTFAADEELLELPLEPSASGVGEPTPGPLYLVCTHGRRDACCALAGRPVADALAEARPGRVFECSHVGGHRFAANVVVLPEGLYYAGLDPRVALAVVEAHELGRITPAALRGRSAYPSVVQAAQHFARAGGHDRIGDLGVLDVAETNGVVRVTLAGAGVVTVRVVPPGAAVRLSCGEEPAAPPPSYELVSWEPAPIPSE